MSDLEILLRQCAVEPDFQVREMLTWALIRLPANRVVPRVIEDLTRPEPQARCQALHTLSKFKDETAWPAVASRLDDENQSVVRTAWYSAVALVPKGERDWLAEKLATRLGHGDAETQLSLSRALVALGKDVIEPLLAVAAERGDATVRQHVDATVRLLQDPDSGFATSLKRARREVALGRTRSTKG
ncbi:HEAT repeat domain-containing protein [Mesorhizobium retamae]|uniref:HEAT repeat domain-containing protein n=1 Tax=Mesorhizobium retamae TaxID=2912854 RepID=A0ABS9QK15_9HYPH|nr:HEAT repeat domain-containing protein [Mesorhizobium sp. IRAMC:0171]MCG7507761.1 HEAT repeat domain-containing protein [Mesorhizobium sp. IRAMC:0171]